MTLKETMDAIIPLPDGVTIQGPGAYRTSLNHYHSQAICPGPSISSSGLRTIFGDGRGPYTSRFWAFSDLNPARFERETNHALDFGRAAHALLLGDEVFEEGFALSPFDDFRTKAAREWRDNETRTVITATDYQHICNMAEALHRAELPDRLFGGLPEVSLIWQDDTGVWLKARPDALPETGDLADLKTTTDASLSGTSRDIFKRGYHMQMALCVEGMERVLGRGLPAGSLPVLVFVEKKPPYAVSHRIISEDALYWGRCQNRAAINAFAACIESGEWGEEPGNLTEWHLPDYAMASLSEMQADGRLPNVRDE